MRLATLDDPAVISAADPGGMLGLIGRTGGQLRRGFELGRAAPALPSAEGIDAVVVCGMGGSGIAGDVVRSTFASVARVPIVVVKGYSLPAFCGHDSMVIAVSFSGNTEETVAAYVEAVTRGCRLVAVSAGGELAALSEADETPHVRIPDDVSMPRAGLGYLAGAAIGVLSATETVPPSEVPVERAATMLDGLAARLGLERSGQDNEAKSVSQWLGPRTPLVWGTEGLAEAAALRWRTQFNENAKMAAFHSILPELDHNEIEGLAGEDGSRFAAMILRHDLEHPRMSARVVATVAALSRTGLEAREVRGPGSTPLEIVFSLILLGDFVSAYTAILRGVDPTPVPVLMGLKERLRR
jgi:glucose/mannose-6-phosphate isomerase